MNESQKSGFRARVVVGWWVVISVLIIVFGGASYLILKGIYPIVVVNRRFVEARDFNGYLKASTYFYRVANQSMSGEQEDGYFETDEARNEIKRAILDKLIEDELTESELRKRMSPADIDAMVSRNIESVLIERNIEKGVGVLYGLKMDEFKNLALEPQAKREILENRMFAENKQFDFEKWLEDEKKKAEVLVIAPGFDWVDGKIVVK